MASNNEPTTPSKERSQLSASSGNIVASTADTAEPVVQQPDEKEFVIIPEVNKSPRLTAEQIEMRINQLLEEFFASTDIAEAVNCVRELQAPDCHPQFIVAAVNMALERKPKDKDQLNLLFVALATDNVLTGEQFARGFEELLEFIEDLDIDIPFASTHLATFIGAIISRRVLPLSFITDSLGHLVHSGKAELIAGVILERVLQEAVISFVWFTPLLNQIYRERAS
jgi:hypothetical protein